MYILNAHIQREGGERVKRGEGGGGRERDGRWGGREGKGESARARASERLNVSKDF
jgi:hypothetical protein